jgi:ribosomal protein S30
MWHPSFNFLKMKKTVLFTLVMAIQVIAFAQFQNESIKDYSLPNLKRQSLDFYFNLNESNQKYFYPKSRNVNSLLDYKAFVNKSDFQFASNVQIVGRYNLIDMNKESIYATPSELKLSKQSHFSIYGKAELRKYLDNEIFIGVNPGVYNSRDEIKQSYEYFYYDPYIDSNDKYANKQNSYAFQTELELGIGRIEQVQDARHAILIYNELRKAGKVKQQIDDVQMNEFAELISRLLNDRVFDKRIIMMKHKTAIDSFLVAQNLASERNSDYYNILSDMYEYGGLQIRESGLRFSVSFTPEYFTIKGDELFIAYGEFNYYYNQYESIIVDEVKRTRLLFGVNLKYEVPINLKWQSSLSFNTHYGKVIDRIDHYNADYNRFDSKLGYKIAFYPNTRTDITFEIAGRIFQSFERTKELNKDVAGMQTISNLSMNYYFSPKLRARIFGGVILQENSLIGRIPFVSPFDEFEVDMEGWFYNVGASLNYYIF